MCLSSLEVPSLSDSYRISTAQEFISDFRPLFKFFNPCGFSSIKSDFSFKEVLLFIYSDESRCNSSSNFKISLRKVHIYCRLSIYPSICQVNELQRRWWLSIVASSSYSTFVFFSFFESHS